MSNRILENIDPARPFYWFEEISKIPRGSGNTKKISDFIVGFAKDHNLRYIQDDTNNVIIFKDAVVTDDTAVSQSDNRETVMIQGHIDMVCEKVDSSDIDFENEGIKLLVDGDIIKADGTTLGGDDGVAVAFMLAILESDDIPHPPLECVFTVDEEIGMLGAMALDTSELKSKKVLNIDSEEEGHLLVSCAGGATVTMHIPVKRRGAQGDRFKLTVSGLLGGHSGIEINRGRANADIVLGNVLKELSLVDDSLKIISVSGGLKDNAIPNKAQAEFVSKKQDIIETSLNEMQTELSSIFDHTDPDIKLTLEKLDVNPNDPDIMYPLEETVNLGFIMCFGSMPFGVKAMSKEIQGLVQTSLNLGILTTSENEITITYSVRSSVTKEKQDMIQELEDLAKSIGGNTIVSGEYPAWELNPDSELTSIMSSVYEELFKKPIVVEAVHAGLECGIFTDKMPGLEVVSFGPDIFDIHTPGERLSISSVQRTWEFIKAVLAKM